LDLLKNNNLDEGTCVIAWDQFGGKGLGANSWESEAGKNLTLSVLLKPHFLAPEKQFMLNKVIALSVYDFVKQLLPAQKVSIKWSNDIYVDDKKVAGILINNTIKGDKLEFTVAGIGININQEVFYSDAPNPVSIINYKKQEQDLEDCLEQLQHMINKRYAQLVNKEYETLDKDYLKDFYRVKQWADFKENNVVFKGKITGINEYGQLIIERENAVLKAYGFKEVSFVI
jgi:BirA family transcriptional regulator, biotin operon repressor / biotin---[acetyl-CoA-carboxylase] ligase